MNPAPPPTRSCFLCGAREHLADHHIAKQENVGSATVTACSRHHFELDTQLYRYGVRPLPGKPSARRPEPSAEAWVLWAFGCGFHLTLSAWLSAIGAEELAREGTRTLVDLARLVAALDGGKVWFGPSPVNDLLSRARSRTRHTRRQRREPRPATVSRFARSLLTALADAAADLLGGSERNAVFVGLIGAIAERSDLLARALADLESYPRLAELERLRKQDLELLRELPRAMLRITRAEVRGVDPNPADLEHLNSFVAIAPVRLQLFSVLAATQNRREVHLSLERNLSYEP